MSQRGLLTGRPDHNNNNNGYDFRGPPLDNLAIALCISIGTGIPWLIAIYSDNGARQLIANSIFGLAGTALVPLILDRIAPAYSILALISVGPVVGLLTIFAGQAARRAISSWFLNSAP